MFVWVLLFRKWVVTASVGTHICGVLVNDGYLYSRVYGNRSTSVCAEHENIVKVDAHVR